MGMDFSALMRYKGPTPELVGALDSLWTAPAEQIVRMAELWEQDGHASLPWSSPAWVQLPDEPRSIELEQPPELPNLGVAFRTREGFYLTFGADVVEVYHLLRWYFFLTEPQWQKVMLDACACLGDLIGSTECVLMSDWHPAIKAFREGKNFASALASADPDQGEVPALADLYIDPGSDSGWDSKGYWRFHRPQGIPPRELAT